MFKRRKLEGLVSSRKVGSPGHTLQFIALPSPSGISAIVYLGISTPVVKGDASGFLSAGGESLGKHQVLSLLPCHSHWFLTLRLCPPGVVPHHEDIVILSRDAGTHRVVLRGGEISFNLSQGSGTALTAAHAMLNGSGWCRPV